MSTTTSSPPTTRHTLGPLITTFTQALDCSVWAVQEYTDGFNGFWAAQGCSDSTVQDTTSCWPSIASSAEVAGPPYLGGGLYSPGFVCPSGWKTACTAAQLSNGAPSPILSGSSFIFQYDLEPEETAVGCCPPGLSCYNPSGIQTCVSTISHGSFQAGFCGNTAFNSLTSVTIPGEVVYQTLTWSGHSAELFAPLIQLNWKSSDLSPQVLTTSASTTLAPSALVTEPSSSSSPSSASPIDQETSGLSNGGKIAVGVAVPLAVLALLFLAAFVWFRRRRRRRPLPSELPQERSPRNYWDVKRSPGVQLDSKLAPQELGARSLPSTRRHELMG